MPAPPALIKRASFSGKIAHLSEHVSRTQGAHEAAWLSLLKLFVQRANTGTGHFADVLGHPLLANHDARGLPDLLTGCSVAEMSVLYELLLADEAMHTKRLKGQFFTPDDVARFMAEKANSLPSGRWLDPCCGIGNLSYWLAHAAPDPEKFLLEQLRLVDTDPLALFSARAILAVTLHRRTPRLFSLMAENVECRDYLEGHPTRDVPFAGEHDYVIMNPPYARAGGDFSSFRSARSRDLYAFFLERALRSSRGVIAITPQSFTNGDRHRDLRRLIIETSHRTTIYVFDNVPDTVFRGYKFGSENTNQVNSTRAAVSVFECTPGGTSRTFRTTPLVRWRAAERAHMFENLDRLLGRPIKPTADLFPKIPPGLEALYEEQLHAPPLSDILVRESEWALNVPMTPRYFITATERPLERSSLVRLYFASEDVRRTAYLLLNSSLAYLWWRVRDGGMTLSKKTLFSTPLPSTVPSLDIQVTLAEALRQSEEKNVVIKWNAGKPNENVKHPPALLARLNSVMAPAFADKLAALHANSSMVGGSVDEQERIAAIGLHGIAAASALQIRPSDQAF